MSHQSIPLRRSSRIAAAPVAAIRLSFLPSLAAPPPFFGGAAFFGGFLAAFTWESPLPALAASHWLISGLLGFAVFCAIISWAACAAIPADEDDRFYGES